MQLDASRSTTKTSRSRPGTGQLPSNFWSLADPPVKLPVEYLQNVGGGYNGPGINKPRKYVRGELRDAYTHPSGCKRGDEEYRLACKSIGAEPNSLVQDLLKGPAGMALEPSKFLGGEWISLRNTYVGERGFIAMLPVLDRNTSWTSLDASNNGLRNEAVLHLVDLMLRPHHTDRVLHLDLSENPISDGAGRAVLELCRLHPHIGEVNLQRTKINRRLLLQVRKTLNQRHIDNTQICRSCGNVFMVDSRFCRKCGYRRVDTKELEALGGENSKEGSVALEKAFLSFSARSASPLSFGRQSPSIAEDQEGRSGGDGLGAPDCGAGSLHSTPLERRSPGTGAEAEAGDPLAAGWPERTGTPLEGVQELGGGEGSSTRREREATF